MAAEYTAQGTTSHTSFRNGGFPASPVSDSESEGATHMQTETFTSANVDYMTALGMQSGNRTGSPGRIALPSVPGPNGSRVRVGRRKFPGYQPLSLGDFSQISARLSAPDRPKKRGYAINPDSDTDEQLSLLPTPSRDDFERTKIPTTQRASSLYSGRSKTDPDIVIFRRLVTRYVAPCKHHCPRPPPPPPVKAKVEDGGTMDVLLPANPVTRSKKSHHVETVNETVEHRDRIVPDSPDGYDVSSSPDGWEMQNELVSSSPDGREMQYEVASASPDVYEMQDGHAVQATRTTTVGPGIRAGHDHDHDQDMDGSYVHITERDNEVGDPYGVEAGHGVQDHDMGHLYEVQQHGSYNDQFMSTHTHTCESPPPEIPSTQTETHNAAFELCVKAVQSYSCHANGQYQNGKVSPVESQVAQNSPVPSLDGRRSLMAREIHGLHATSQHHSGENGFAVTQHGHISHVLQGTPEYQHSYSPYGNESQQHVGYSFNIQGITPTRYQAVGPSFPRATDLSPPYLKMAFDAKLGMFQKTQQYHTILYRFQALLAMAVSGSDKKLGLHHMIRKMFNMGLVNEQDHSKENVHIFVDMSNIFISFQEYAKHKCKRAASGRLPLIYFEVLALILERGRTLGKQHLAGSVKEEHQRDNLLPHFKAAESLQYKVNIFLRVPKAVSKAPVTNQATNKATNRATNKAGGRAGGRAGGKAGGRGANRATGRQNGVKLSAGNPKLNSTSGDDESGDSPGHSPRVIQYTEQGVDENIHLAMQESVLNELETDGSKTMVLATGDAKTAEFSQGFAYYAVAALKRGWKLEIVAFRRSISSDWRRHPFSDEYADRVRIIELDDWFDELFAYSL